MRQTSGEITHARTEFFAARKLPVDDNRPNVSPSPVRRRRRRRLLLIVPFRGRARNTVCVCVRSGKRLIYSNYRVW